MQQKEESVVDKKEGEIDKKRSEIDKKIGAAEGRKCN